MRGRYIFVAGTKEDDIQAEIIFKEGTRILRVDLTRLDNAFWPLLKAAFPDQLEQTVDYKEERDLLLECTDAEQHRVASMLAYRPAHAS